MFTHMFLGTNDLDRSRSFYEAAMAPLGRQNVMPADQPQLVFPSDSSTLIISAPANGEAATSANGFTVGFTAPDMAAVDAFHAAGLANGGRDEGAPGHRANAPGKAYGAYLRDPDGHKICAFCQMPD
jgi:catechol 2,3-dioxygenase-like lactoylglutathione lyase family enzyme